jgi:hypothetical protein
MSRFLFQVHCERNRRVVDLGTVDSGKTLVATADASEAIARARAVIWAALRMARLPKKRLCADALGIDTGAVAVAVMLATRHIAHHPVPPTVAGAEIRTAVLRCTKSMATAVVLAAEARTMTT